MADCLNYYSHVLRDQALEVTHVVIAAISEVNMKSEIL